MKYSKYLKYFLRFRYPQNLFVPKNATASHTSYPYECITVYITGRAYNHSLMTNRMLNMIKLNKWEI